VRSLLRSELPALLALAAVVLGFLCACGAEPTAEAVPPGPAWEDVGPSLARFPVPGGWVYRYASFDRGGLAFVPDTGAGQ